MKYAPTSQVGANLSTIWARISEQCPELKVIRGQSHNFKHILRSWLKFATCLLHFLTCHLEFLQTYYLISCVVKTKVGVFVYRDADAAVVHKVSLRLRVHATTCHIGAVSVSADMGSNIRLLMQ